MLFLTESYYVVQAGLQLAVILLPPCLSAGATSSAAMLTSQSLLGADCALPTPSPQPLCCFLLKVAFSEKPPLPSSAACEMSSALPGIGRHEELHVQSCRGLVVQRAPPMGGLKRCSSPGMGVHCEATLQEHRTGKEQGHGSQVSSLLCGTLQSGFAEPVSPLGSRMSQPPLPHTLGYGCLSSWHWEALKYAHCNLV